MRSKREQAAFTLVELLVATSLMALVGGASVAALAGGVRVWERAAAFGTAQHSFLVATDRMRRDLQNVRRFKPILFEGSYNQYAAASVGRADPRSDRSEELGRLGYFLDERQHRLCRSFVPYRLMRRDRLTDHCHAMLDDVTRMRWSYYGKNDERATTGWCEHWRSSEPPLAVKCTLTLQLPHHDAIPHTLMVSLASASAQDEPKP